MPEAGGSFIPFEKVQTSTVPPDVRAFFDEVKGVALRLNHNVISFEHALVVGAEEGEELMARNVPSLSAFREALLDALFEDRNEFRYEPDAGTEEMFVRPDVARSVQQLSQGKPRGELLAEIMLSDSPRIRKAIAFSRGNEPEIVPPDTITLDRLGDSHDSLDLSAAAEAAAPQPEAAPAAELPLTMNLGVETIDDPAVVGRDGLFDQVARILLRFHEPSVLLIGAPGAGKTSFVRGLARAAASGALPALDEFHFYQLKLLDLVSQSHRGQDPHGMVDQILTAISSDPTGVLVIDDLHLLVAKQGYPLMSDLIDTVKLHISKGKVRALMTVDADAYQKAFGNDTFFTSQITVKHLPSLERDALLDVIRLYKPRLEKHFRLTIQDAAVTSAVEASLSEDSPEYFAPGSTIRLLDEACAMARSEMQDEVLPDHVHRCFSEEAQTHAHPDRERLKAIEEKLGKRVLGQEVAAGAVARRVRLAKLHLDRKPERPDGVFLFMGPSGVGKTEMARSLSRALYDDESRLVRLDMSEYMEPHAVARIIGAPPGYVGYGEDGALTGPVADLGHCVVLLDEIEKAHPRVLNLFLQVFDDGRLTDSKGRLVNFADTVIIMTSNIGRELYAIHGEAAIGFGQSEEEKEDKPLRDAVQDHLLRVLPSEFVNRIDEIVPFRVLQDADIIRIAKNLLDQETERWTGRGKKLTWESNIPDILALTGYDPRLGARHVERNLERLVISLISEAAVTNRFEQVKELGLVAQDGIICLKLDGEAFQCLASDGNVSKDVAQPDPPERSRSDGSSSAD